LLDDSGCFVGGTIFPGLRLMALAMHEHTAKLPLVEATSNDRETVPGKNTESAMRLGILHAVAGGIDSIVRELATKCDVAPKLFLTGGDMVPRLTSLLESRFQFEFEVRPSLTLEGIQLAAEWL
jgi:type III pantothenate kinase